MAPTKERKPAKPQAAASGKKKSSSFKNVVVGKTGLTRYSTGAAFQKKRLYKVMKTKEKRKTGRPISKTSKRITRQLKRKNQAKAAEKKAKATGKPVPARGNFITKKVNSKKGEQTRRVPVRRRPRLYETQRRKVLLKRGKVTKTNKLRPGIKTGQVLILLAGRHKGKRVVFLKQLESGLLLVNGPFSYNGCPLRRINQIYVIPTSARITMKFPKDLPKIDDAFFARAKNTKPKHGEGSVFATTKEEYKPSDQRKAYQVLFDKVVVDAIKARDDKKQFGEYLRTMWSLRNGEMPHNMVF